MSNESNLMIKFLNSIGEGISVKQFVSDYYPNGEFYLNYFFKKEYIIDDGNVIKLTSKGKAVRNHE